MLEHLVMFAQDPATPPTTQPTGADGQSPWGGFFNLLIIPVLVILFYFVMLRPMRRQEAERLKLQTGLKKNDRILMHSGIYGTVVNVSDTDDEITVKIDDNVRIKIIKAAIARNLTNEEALKAEKDKGKAAAPASAPADAVTNQPPDKK